MLCARIAAHMLIGVRHMNTIDSIQRAGTVNMILQDVREKIIFNNYADGEAITETQLAKEYAVSRSSVRTALQVLENEGLIVVGANGRKTVQGINQRFISDFYETRALLEAKAVEIILKREYVDYSGLMRALNILNQARSETGDAQTALRIQGNNLFHTELVYQSGNRALIQCWRTLNPLREVFSYYNASLSANHVRHDFYTSHQEILKMLVARDPKLHEYILFHTSGASTEDTLKGIALKKAQRKQD